MEDEIAQALTGNAAEIAGQMSGNAEDYVNDLLCAVDPQHLKLTKQDDEIYAAFRRDFPHLPIEVVAEADLKSPQMKEKWREFAEALQHVDDYNFGTLLRLDAGRLYDSDNTIFATRIQFLAIEIARNREGVNTAKQKTLQQLHAAQGAKR